VVFETEFYPVEGESEELMSYQSLQAELHAAGHVNHMLTYLLYSDIMLKADRCIGHLAAMADISQDQSIQCLHDWIQSAPETLRFPLSEDQLPDFIWRSAHQYDQWRSFSELAMHITTLGIPEADVEKFISPHRDLASLKGTEYPHRTLRNRLRLRISRA
jgi:hypothetical protein